MLRKLLLLTLFLLGTSGLLTFSFIFLLSTSSNSKSNNNLSMLKTPNSFVYAAIPATDALMQTNVIEDDAQATSIKKLLDRYKSPLADYAQFFVDTANKYNLDYRLLPTLAIAESGGGKKMPANSFNPFGFGIYGKHITRFDNFNEAIETVAKTLAIEYKDKRGLNTTEEIMTRYNPSNHADEAKKITSLISQIE